MYILVIGDQFGFISTILLYFLTRPALSASFLPLFSCLVLLCVLIRYDCRPVATDSPKLSEAHNYAKLFLTLSLRLAAALPARPFILCCGSTPRIGSVGPGLRITGSLGQGAVAGTPETKPRCARTPRPLSVPHPLTFHWLNLVTWSSPSLVEWSIYSSWNEA